MASGTRASVEAVPVVFLHGLFGKPDNWEPIMSYLERDRRMLALEYPLGELPAGASSMEGLTEYTLEFLERAGIERAVFAGNSLGGHVALRLAISHPERVAGLALLGSSGLYERQITPKRPTLVTRAQLSRMIGEVFYDQRFVTDELVEEAYQALRARATRRGIILIARSARSENLASELCRIEAPTLIGWGTEDTITPPEVAEEFHAGIADSELHMLPECCHTPQMEHPEEVAALLARFLRRVDENERLLGNRGKLRRGLAVIGSAARAAKRFAAAPIVGMMGGETLVAEAGS